MLPIAETVSKQSFKGWGWSWQLPLNAWFGESYPCHLYAWYSLSCQCPIMSAPDFSWILHVLEIHSNSQSEVFMCICRELCSLAPCRGTSVAKQTRKEPKKETNKPEDKQRNKKQEKKAQAKKQWRNQGNNGIVNREQETDKETTKHSQAYCKQRGSWPDWPLSTWTQNNSALPSKDGRGAFNRPSAILDSCINKILCGSSHVYTKSLAILRTMWVRMKLGFPKIQW